MARCRSGSGCSGCTPCSLPLACGCSSGRRGCIVAGLRRRAVPVRKIDNYVMRTVGGAMFLVMVVVLSLDVIFAFIAELEDTRNDYQTLQALWYVALTLPRRIYDYLPLGAFMGCLRSEERRVGKECGAGWAR